jgi:hypothetical protein
MKPKNRKEILDICQEHFWDYSTLTKILIFASVLLSATSLVAYICGYIYPTVCGIIYCDITGFDIVWRVFLAFILYFIWRSANLIFISIGGAAMCSEENWDTEDFALAWMNMSDNINNF